MPLDSLKELSEEIGFIPQDYENYIRLLEMNVIAPRLCDMKAVEDTHLWGQEETRRRGTLATQVRGVVVKDVRGGGLQLMSQGDPSLILNYCREYWDGSNITPLSSTDRQEVLKVYDRWDLEDFDVVAFSYTPVPFYLQKNIIETFGSSAKSANANNPKYSEYNKQILLSSSSSSYSSSTNKRTANERFSPHIGTNSLFYVDPRSERDLLPKYKKDVSIDSEGGGGGPLKHDQDEVKNGKLTDASNAPVPENGNLLNEKILSSMDGNISYQKMDLLIDSANTAQGVDKIKQQASPGEYQLLLQGDEFLDEIEEGEILADIDNEVEIQPPLDLDIVYDEEMIASSLVDEELLILLETSVDVEVDQPPCKLSDTLYPAWAKEADKGNAINGSTTTTNISKSSETFKNRVEADSFDNTLEEMSIQLKNNYEAKTGSNSSDISQDQNEFMIGIGADLTELLNDSDDINNDHNENKNCDITNQSYRNNSKKKNPKIFTGFPDPIPITKSRSLDHGLAYLDLNPV